jgi:hypothetical protein
MFGQMNTRYRDLAGVSDLDDILAHIDELMALVFESVLRTVSLSGYSAQQT